MLASSNLMPGFVLPPLAASPFLLCVLLSSRLAPATAGRPLNVLESAESWEREVVNEFHA
jgi:hypothetical protein